jgi:hypothetical protein
MQIVVNRNIDKADKPGYFLNIYSRQIRNYYVSIVLLTIL